MGDFLACILQVAGLAVTWLCSVAEPASHSRATRNVNGSCRFRGSPVQPEVRNRSSVSGVHFPLTKAGKFCPRARARVSSDSLIHADSDCLTVGDACVPYMRTQYKPNLQQRAKYHDKCDTKAQEGPWELS